MYDSCFTFRSLTAAQQGLQVCLAAGLPVHLARTPSQLAKLGCGYALFVPASSFQRTAWELRLANVPFSHGFRRRGSRWEEAAV